MTSLTGAGAPSFGSTEQWENWSKEIGNLEDVEPKGDEKSQSSELGLSSSDDNSSESIFQKGVKYIQSKNLPEAIKFISQAIEHEKNHKKNPDCLAEYLTTLADAYFLLNQPNHVLENLKEALEILVKTYGENDPIICPILNKLAAVTLLIDPEETITLYLRSIKIMETSDPGNVELKATFFNLAKLYARLQNYDLAISFLIKTLQVDRKYHKGKDDCSLTQIIGRAFYQKGDLNKAKEWLEESVQLHKKAYGDNHEDTKSVAMELHTVKVSLGEEEPTEKEMKAAAEAAAAQAIADWLKDGMMGKDKPLEEYLLGNHRINSTDSSDDCSCCSKCVVS